MTEMCLRLKAGDITWAVVSKVYIGKLHVCVEFYLKGKDFLTIAGEVYDEYIDETEFIDDVIYVQSILMERVPITLSTYGLQYLVENVAKKGMSMIFVVDVEKDQDYLTDLNLRNLSLN